MAFGKIAETSSQGIKCKFLINKIAITERRGEEVRRNFEVCVWGEILKLHPNRERTGVVCCILQFVCGEKPLWLGDFPALADTSALRISFCHSEYHFPCGGSTCCFHQFGKMLPCLLGVESYLPSVLLEQGIRKLSSNFSALDSVS